MELVKQVMSRLQQPQQQQYLFVPQIGEQIIAEPIVSSEDDVAPRSVEQDRDVPALQEEMVTLEYSPVQAEAMPAVPLEH